MFSEKLSFDEISYLNDDELYKNIDTLYNSKKEGRGNRYEIEVEISYYAREAEIRKLRKERHAEWVELNPVDEFVWVNESQFPDFENDQLIIQLMKDR